MTTLTPLELAIMRSVWRRGEARVRDVQADLVPSRALAYTTIMTVLDRLFKKGIVSRKKRARAHVYTPRFSEAEVRSDAVQSLLEGYFGGSPSALQAYLENGQKPQRLKAVPRGRESGHEAPVEHRMEDSLL